MSAAARWSLTAKATLWVLQSRDGFSGALIFAAPVVIACDYQGKTQTRTDSRGREFVSSRSVYTEHPNVKAGDRVMLGESTAADPVAAGALEVRDVARYADTFDRLADDYELIC